jgi:hypothetical protein
MDTITSTQLVGVELSFTFENGVTNDSLATIKRKVQRTIESIDYSANSMFFVTHNEIRAIIAIDVEEFNAYKSYDELRKPLQRLIDTHKEAATYGFSY